MNGLQIVVLKEGQPLSEMDLQLQGYYQGAVTIDSELCEIHDSFRYVGATLHDYTLPGVAEKSCLLDMVVAHEWPKEDSSGLVIDPVKGRIWMVVTNRKIYTQTNKVKEGLEAHLRFPGPEGDGSARVVLRSGAPCAVSYDETHAVVNGEIEVKMSDLGAFKSGDQCQVSGAVIGSSERYRLAWMFWVYDKTFTPLPKPTIEIDGDEIDIEAHTGVSIVALDNLYKVHYKADFDFDPMKPHVLRLMTVKGRLLVGLWDPADREWIWIQ